MSSAEGETNEETSGLDPSVALLRYIGRELAWGIEDTSCPRSVSMAPSRAPTSPFLFISPRNHTTYVLVSSTPFRNGLHNCGTLLAIH
jgi:hypothetical protein